MHRIRRELKLKKKYLGILLLIAVCVVGCGENSTEKPSTTDTQDAISEESPLNEKETKGEDETGNDKFDIKAEFPNLRIGDSVCVEGMGGEGTYQYKFTLNAVEYSNGEINGFPADSDSDGFIVIDVTLEGVGSDVSYGIVFSQLYVGGLQFYPKEQADYGLNTFANPDEMLSEGEKITGRIAINFAKTDIEVNKTGILMTQFIYNVAENEIKDYIPGEQ